MDWTEDRQAEVNKDSSQSRYSLWVCPQHIVFWYHVLVLDLSVSVCVHVVTGVALDEAAVQVSQLLSADVSGRVVGGLEVQVVLSTAEELGGSHIHPDDDLVGVTGLLDG